MRIRDGFTIFELLIVILVGLIVLGGAFMSYTKFLREFKGESESEESYLERIAGAELIRLDVEHAGLGLSSGETAPQIDWGENVKTLTIHSTLNNTNRKTYGFIFVDCSSGWPQNFTAGSCVNNACDKRDDTSNNDLVYLNAINKSYIGIGSFGTCPGTGLYIGIPYDNSVSNGCNAGYCYKIRYYLSASQTASHCNPGTRNLIRAVGSTDVGQPVLYCVSDFRVRFDLDTNNDGVIDTTLDRPSNASITPDNIKRQLKQVRIYLLVQEGGLDKDYSFRGNTTVDGINLQLPQNYQSYRWKIYRFIIKPMDL